MAQIQWYPGHMHKAARDMRDALSTVDMFIELRDARLPFSSANPMLEEIRGDKPCVQLLTKRDLADPARTETWLSWFGREKKTVLAVSSADRKQIRELAGTCRGLFPGREQPIAVMVVGIPNVGKSTVINILANRAVAKTGNEPAVTKMQQRIQLEHDVVLLDTPGVLWPNVENPHSGYRLAASGAIRQTALSHDDVAWYLAEFLLQQYLSLIEARYQYDGKNLDPARLLDHIGRKRGCLKSGGKVDLDRVSRILLTEFREGLIGRITLETPEMMESELVEVERVRIEKAEKKARRKARWKNKN